MKIKVNANLIITFFQLIAFLTLTFFLSKIIIWQKNSISDKTKNEELIKEVLNENMISDNINIYSEEKNTYYKKNININFKKLHSINTDIIAWITINNTNINYPILQTYDNDFYLHRNFKKDYSQSGSIFINSNNNMFLDKNTIIYGHNMNDGSMFHDLFKIYNNEIGNDVIVEIYTENDNFKYQVISSYIDYPNNLTYSYDFDNLISKSKINFQFSNINKERLLTLYTCNFLGDKRLVIHAAKMT